MKNKEVIVTTHLSDPSLRVMRIQCKGLIEGLRMIIQGAKNTLPIELPASAELDVAQQVITRIEETVNR
jgi:hypothetical protein